LKHISLFIALFFGLIALQTSAQDVLTGSGSTYSYLGIGTPVDNMSPQGSGMGLTGVAISNAEKPSLANPAFWGNPFYTTISAGMSLNYYDASDNFTSSENTNINFTYAHVVLPVIKNRLGISLAIYPETESRYNIQTLRSVQLPTADGAQNVNYTSQSIGFGGLNRLEVGFGLRLNQNIYVGYAPSILFGVKRSENNLFFDNMLFQPINYTFRTRYRSFGHRFGVAAHTNNVFRNRDRLEFGATFNVASEMDAYRRMTSSIISTNQIGTVEFVSEDDFGKREITFPMQFAAGISYYPSRYLLLSTDVKFQQWSDYSNFNPATESFTKDRIKAGLGFEYNLYNRGESGFLNSFVYRGGFSYDTGHLVLDGTNIETILFSVGLGIPVRTVGSSIDLGFDFGTRGTKSNNLVRERIFAFKASFNLSELMFLQRRLN
jgi:hypothetical protein